MPFGYCKGRIGRRGFTGDDTRPSSAFVARASRPAVVHGWRCGMLPPDCVRVTGAVQPGLAPGASTVASGLTLCELKLLSPHGLMRPALFPTLFADRTWRREHFESLRYAVSTRRTTPRPRWHRAASRATPRRCIRLTSGGCARTHSRTRSVRLRRFWARAASTFRGSSGTWRSRTGCGTQERVTSACCTRQATSGLVFTRDWCMRISGAPSRTRSGRALTRSKRPGSRPASSRC